MTVTSPQPWACSMGSASIWGSLWMPPLEDGRWRLTSPDLVDVDLSRLVFSKVAENPTWILPTGHHSSSKQAAS